jgi:hypothetical protein
MENETKALRFNDGKLQWSLVDFESLEPMVKVLEFGAKKYAPENWRKGLETTKIIESMLRHTFALLRGEDNDPESGIEHVGHIQCNAMFLAKMLKDPKWDNRDGKVSMNFTPCPTCSLPEEQCGCLTN